MKKLPQVLIVTIASLHENPENTNVMDEVDYRQLVANIKEVGFLQPILVVDGPSDGTYQIVDGHHRARAAKEAGLETVLAVMWDGSEEMRIAVSLGMNRLRGDVDLARAAAAIHTLVEQGWDEEALKLTGFDDKELKALLEATSSKDDISLDDVGNLFSGTDLEPEDDEKPPRPFILELTFSNGTALKKVKKALKKAAPGLELSDGLLVVLGIKE